MNAAREELARQIVLIHAAAGGYKPLNSDLPG